MIAKICSLTQIKPFINTKQVSFRSQDMQNDTFLRTNNNFKQAYDCAKKKIIQAIIDTNTEYSVVLAENGQVLDENQGSEHSCSIDSRKVEQNSILMHGHPKPLPLSSGDIACLLASKAKSQEAITKDGKYSRLTKKETNRPLLNYRETYFQLEKSLCLKALDKLGIDYKLNKHDIANMFKDYLNYQCGTNPEEITDEKAFEEMPKYGVIFQEDNIDETYSQLKELMWWQLMSDPQKYDKEHHTIMNNYDLINSYLDSETGFETRVEFVKEVANQYNLEYESNL